jgi:glucosyl-3-phosphoglycerate synthase
MVSVVIPAWNEAKTIQQVIRMSLGSKHVSQVIVVDDQSDDGTADLARDTGAEVLISQRRGKGISMKEGVDAAKNELIVFLYSDIDPYPDLTIENLTRLQHLLLVRPRIRHWLMVYCCLAGAIEAKS